MKREFENPGSLSGKSALVTGGAKRLGRAIVLELARAGADITITYRRSGDEAVETVDAIEQLGRRAFAVQCDVRSQASVQAAVAGTVAEHGRLDILVNNAGVFHTTPLDQITLEQWDEVFETNARGPFLVSREALPHLRAARGCIVHLGSLGGLRPWASHAHYCASKAALHMLTQAQAKAWAPEVTVNCVAPGFIAIDEQDTGAEHFAGKTPMGRNGTAEDVARAVLFFAAAPGFITGQVMAVDGGLGL